jgi:hypothetical protein
MASSQQVPLGTLNPWSGAGPYNTLVQLIQNQLSKVQTVTLCQVQSCTNSGGLAPFGFVDVLPLVSQVDGAGNAVPHVTLHEVPYLRIQGGSSAIIIDPQPGDVGILLTCSRDITSVVATQGQNTPGSPRQFSFADSLYLGGLLNSQPTQYLQFNEDGITVVSLGGLILQSGGDTDITASGDVVIAANSIRAGSSPVPVCSQPLVTWINSTLLPALAAHSITVSAPPSDSLTSTFEAS